MKNYKTRILILFLIFIFSYSCSFSKKAKRSEHIELANTNFKEVTGTFSYLGAENGVKQVGTIFQSFSSDTLISKEYCVQLYDVTKISLKVNLLLKDFLIKSITFKGKFKRGLFKSKAKLKILFPFPALLWEWRKETVYFGLTPNKDLLVVNDRGSAGFWVTFPLSPGSSGEDFLKTLIRM